MAITRTAMAVAIAAALALAGCGGGPAGLPPAPKTPPPVSTIGEPGPPVHWSRYDPQLKIKIDMMAQIDDCAGMARTRTQVPPVPQDVQRYLAWLQRISGCTA